MHKQKKVKVQAQTQTPKRGFTITKKMGVFLIIAVTLIISCILIFHHNPLADPHEEIVKKVIACAITLTACVVSIALYDKITVLPKELWQNRKLIWKLSQNDFRTKYAGSSMGRVWAFIQPVVTVAMYYFVFDVVFQSRAQLVANGIKAPYVLWLTAGLVPWFYFSEALGSGTSALLEYNYLVKKVVFKISILPIIKIIAATFVHVFFATVLIVIYFCYGEQPSWYLLQIPYFSICMFVFVLACSYATCSIVVFFKDLTQIISILLQIGMWATPILWDISQIPEQLRLLFKLNPVFYIVNGYRSALFEHQWFWEDFYSTMYFWIITVVIFGISSLIFKRLKVHFADVL